jgi:NADPH2:quinone reductase
VAAIPGLGGLAEVVASEPRSVFKLPDTVDFEAGAAIPMNYFTVHFALSRRARLRAGETVLVHGAAGGIGTAAIQYAKVLGARVIAVVSSDAKARVAKQTGADDVVLAELFKDEARRLTDGRGVDVVVDPVGGAERFTDSLRSLAPEGRALVIGFTAGEIPTVKVNRLLLNNIEVVGVGWGAFVAAHPDYLGEQWSELTPLLESGALRPLIGAVYSLDDAADALAEIDERRATGNVVLRIR